jgi:hypothetical protein
MQRQLTNPVRARLTVEALESRELPSVSLTAFRSPASQTSLAQVRYQSPTPWNPGYPIWVPTTPAPIGVPTTPHIIGVLVAL